jgi:GNAT superfamily N-acetyltransferase
MITIRKATEADLDILYRFEQGIVETERPFDCTLKNGIIHYYDLKELIHSDNARVIVAEEEGEISGSGYAEIRGAKDYLDHSRYVHLGFMFTVPSARGKGINKKILDELITWSRSKGIEEIRLEVYAKNVVAKQAYEKFGFKEHMLEMRLGLK